MRFIKWKSLEYEKKSVIINNGIDEFWLSNINKKKDKIPKVILFVGRFDNNKNVISIIKAFLQLNRINCNLKLNLVGGLGKNEKVVKDLVARSKDRIKYFGVISSVKDLHGVYKESDIFAMVSHRETFGLVYIEALSQGLPILYTKNQGIDFTFVENIGIGVNSRSVDDIFYGLKYIVDNYNDFEINEINFQKFHWNDIGLKYLEIYSAILMRSKSTGIS
jgi:glycosyltransferase involved in cell wall biosynthesis